MAVKSIAVLVMVVVLGAGLGRRGPRAQPLPVTSVAFRLCQLGEQMPQPCRPIVSPERAALDDGGRDYDGGFAAGGGGGGDKGGGGAGGRGGVGGAAAAPAGGVCGRPPLSLLGGRGGRGPPLPPGGEAGCG